MATEVIELDELRAKIELAEKERAEKFEAEEQVKRQACAEAILAILAEHNFVLSCTVPPLSIDENGAIRIGRPEIMLSRPPETQ